MYKREEVDQLADEITLVLLQNLGEAELEPTVFRVATASDTQAIYNVVYSLTDEQGNHWQATPPSLRRLWYEVNPQIDYVVEQNGLVVGYVNFTPYYPEVMEKVMSGELRGWQIKPANILPYTPGHTYDVFVGLAARSDIPDRARYGRRMILGMRQVLSAWASRSIYISRLYATSSEDDGIALAKLLGFEKQEEREGDLFGRYVLDLSLSPHPFARSYRALVSKSN